MDEVTIFFLPVCDSISRSGGRFVGLSVRWSVKIRSTRLMAIGLVLGLQR